MNRREIRAQRRIRESNARRKIHVDYWMSIGKGSRRCRMCYGTIKKNTLHMNIPAVSHKTSALHFCADCVTEILKHLRGHENRESVIFI